MSSTGIHDPAPASAGELRDRLPQKPEQPQQASTTDEAQKTVKGLNDQESTKLDKDKRTYGRTPDGTGASLLSPTPIHRAIATATLSTPIAVWLM